MKLITSPSEIRDLARKLNQDCKKIGFVPTMGFLHEGHRSLVQTAREENDIVIVSIFVNPTQFGPQEDFAKYPRDLVRDQALLEPLTDYLFYPEVDRIYSPDEKISFRVKDLTECLCGPFRPGHFEGVIQVLTKFFHLIQPSKVYLGQKDYQQTVIVRQAVRDFLFDLEVVVCPTVREKDGLAMSSRNVYLSTEEREKAIFLYQSLHRGIELLKRGERNTEAIIQKVRTFLEQKGMNRIDYIDLRDASTLEKRSNIEGLIVLAGALYVGTTRLIDNILFDSHAP